MAIDRNRFVRFISRGLQNPGAQSVKPHPDIPEDIADYLLLEEGLTFMTEVGETMVLESSP